MAVCFLGGDSRTPWASAFVEQAGYDLTEDGRSASHVILPMPAFDAQGRVRNGPDLETLLSMLEPGKTVVGGVLAPWRTRLEETCGAVFDFSQDAMLAAANAAVTAEGAVGLAMTKLPVTLEGTPVLVVGWGRIGQLLCRKLDALGAKVTASARKPADLAIISAMGYGHEVTGQWTNPGRYRVIFNTVPAPVFTAAQMDCADAGCIFMELASSPGGFGSTADGRIVQAGGLPGKTAPETAGKLLGASVVRLLRGEWR